MKCWNCDKEASAICAFCGVALCKSCARAQRYISGISAQGPKGWARFPTQMYDAIIVDNAVWCGKCKLWTMRSD